MKKAVVLVPARERIAKAWCAALLGACGLIAFGAVHAQGTQRLRVQVSDAPPSESTGFVHGADNSYTVSTGGSGVEDRTRGAVHANGTTVATGSSQRELHLREGEPVQVDLPSVQALQFHLPAIAPGAASAAPGAMAGGPAAASAKAGASGANAGVSGVVTFAAVSAFTARFSLAGGSVRIDLTPLGAGGVSAPWSGVGAPHPLTLVGRVGEWIALGDPDLSPTAGRLTPSADAPAASPVWVRVYPEGGNPR